MLEEKEFLSFDRNDDLTDFEKLNSISQYKKLKKLSVPFTNLSDEGLAIISKNISIENLNLQGTKISNAGISYLKNLSNLKILRLKDCEFIDDACMHDIDKIEFLENLDIHETSITEEGLAYLFNGNLREIILEIWDGNFSYEGLMKISKQLPNCNILSKGDCLIKNGKKRFN